MSEHPRHLANESFDHSFGPRLLEAGKSPELRARALPVLAAAIQAVDPYTAVRRALSRTGELLQLGDHSYDLARIDRVLVVGAGKAGAPMARAVEDVLGERLTAGQLNVKRGHVEPTRLVQLHEAGHPIPDNDGLEGTARIVALVESAGARDLVLCLISGGGSALLQLPAEGISLADTQQVTDLLLRAGATINELNAVRKHLSRVTGGQLARLARPARVASLLLSDVVGNPPDVIASGPTAPDHSTFADAVAILERFDLWPEVGASGAGATSLVGERHSSLPISVVARLEAGRRGQLPETPKADDPLFQSVQNVVVASNELAALAALAEAERRGFRALLLSTFVEGEAREVGRVVAGLAREVAAAGRPLPRPCCLVLGGETTVTVHGQGLGGRNQELALSAAPKLDGVQDVLVVGLATDGNDGPTDAAGAVADGTTMARARALALDPYDYLARNDSYHFFEPLGDLLLTGPTNTNVNDLVFVFAF
jgi:hydroxypyruvate reductase